MNVMGEDAIGSEPETGPERAGVKEGHATQLVPHSHPLMKTDAGGSHVHY